MTRFPIIPTTFAEYEKMDLIDQLQFWLDLPETNSEFTSDWGGDILMKQRPTIKAALQLIKDKVS